MTLAQPLNRKEEASRAQLLREYLQCLQQSKADRRAVEVGVSLLRPSHRRDQQMQVAATSFLALEQTLRAQLFILPAGDMLLFYETSAHGIVASAIAKLEHRFADDLVASGSEARRFATWFNVRTDLAEIHRRVSNQGARHPATARPATSSHSGANHPGNAHEQELTPEWLAKLQASLAHMDLSAFIRRHRVCQIGKDSLPRPVFVELTISVAELAATVIPGMDLFSNAWLFQSLTETFDQRMLAYLASPEGHGSSLSTSINLNVSTLLSDGFLVFDSKLAAARRGTIVIELKATDIFADLEAYHFARRFVQGRHYMICIDGMTHRTIDLVDRAMLGADFIKADFTGDLFEGGDAARDRLSAIVERNGVDHVILARIETPQALMFGQAAGLQYFQGYHIEKLLREQHNGDRSRLLRSYQFRTGH